MISEGFFLGAQTLRWPAHDGEVGIIFRYAIQNFLAIADFVIKAVKIVIPAKAGNPWRCRKFIGQMDSRLRGNEGPA